MNNKLYFLTNKRIRHKITFEITSKEKEVSSLLVCFYIRYTISKSKITLLVVLNNYIVSWMESKKDNTHFCFKKN